jgi:hypothetical protein
VFAKQIVLVYTYTNTDEVLNTNFVIAEISYFLWPIKSAKAKKAGILNPVLHHSGIHPDQGLAGIRLEK